MVRHSANQNTKDFISQNELRKMGYAGTVTERLGKDSAKPFDSCCLCIAPAVVPQTCSKGHVFCKECIFEAVLAQREGLQRQARRFEAQTRDLKDEKSKLGTEIETERERRFEANELGIAVTKGAGDSVVSGSLSNIEERNLGVNDILTLSKRPRMTDEADDKGVKAFWIPSHTPQASVRPVEKPRTHTICPYGMEPLRLKKLVPIVFKRACRMEERKDETLAARYECFICSKSFSPSAEVSVLRACGHAFCRKCFDQFIKTEGRCSVCDKRVASGDVIDLEVGACGFASKLGDRLKGSRVQPTLT